MFQREIQEKGCGVCPSAFQGVHALADKRLSVCFCACVHKQMSVKVCFSAFFYVYYVGRFGCGVVGSDESPQGPVVQYLGIKP